MPTVSRDGIYAGFAPDTWTCFFTKNEDPMFSGGITPSGIMGGYNGVQLHIEADHLNAANVTVRIQDSVDGVNWVTRVTSVPIVPGGELTFAVHHRGNFVRGQVLSAAAGRITASMLRPEFVANPALWCDEVATY